jgi:hypothetical protein
MGHRSGAMTDDDVERSVLVTPAEQAACLRVDRHRRHVLARAQGDAMPDLASELSQLTPTRERFPWPGYEYVKGWGVFGLPFDSGHVLALRVFPANDFGPYRTIWHRDPAGKWSIYVDGPRLDTACPRYYGAACERTDFARFNLTWTGPMSLRIEVERPSIQWTLTAIETPTLSFLNSVSASLPLGTWRPPALIRAREAMARWLGMGNIQMAGTMPNGQWGILMPQRMYFIEESKAVIDGVDLGAPARLDETPKIGAIPLPARGVLAVGQAAWLISDQTKYDQTRAETAVSFQPLAAE